MREFKPILDWEWLDDGCLKTITKVLPAIRLDKRTGIHHIRLFYIRMIVFLF